jgi:quercetin dioxygenase-like cupin family protein
MPGTPVDRLPVFAEERGALTVVDHDAMPFTPTRCYVLSEIPAGARRGGHGWRTQNRYLVVIGGRAVLSVEGQPDQTLAAADAVHLPPGTWHELRAEGPGLTVLVLADGVHDRSDMLTR